MADQERLLRTAFVAGAITDAVAVLSGSLGVWYALATWCLQAVLLGLFAAAYAHAAAQPVAP